MQHEQRETPFTIEMASWQPLLLAGCLLVTLAMAVISWLAYWIEAEMMGLYSLLLWLSLGSVGLFWLGHLPCKVARQADVITLSWWWKEEQVAIDTIRDIRHSRYQLRLATPDRHYRFTFIMPNETAQLLTWFEAHVPVAAAQRAQRRNRGLPLTITPRLTAPMITVGFIITCGIVGGALLWTSWQQWQRGDSVTDAIGMGAFAMFVLFLATIFLFMLFDSYVWRFTFDAETITLRHTLRTERYPTNGITQMALVTEGRTVKGIVHQIAKLRIHFVDGATVDIAPNLPSFPMDYAGTEEARLLTDLLALLEQHYTQVVQVALDREAMADERWGTPALAIQWQIRPLRRHGYTARLWRTSRDGEHDPYPGRPQRSWRDAFPHH